jgi:5-methylcytosine-specific restriction protein B
LEISVTLRAPQFRSGSVGVPFAALIAMVIGTQGLSPDEDVFARPGHGRKVTTICKWLNKEYGAGEMIAWAKQDPARIDLDIPANVKKMFPGYQTVFNRYGRVIYGFLVPGLKRQATVDCLKAFLDLMFSERGHQPLKGAEEDAACNFTGASRDW